MCGAGGLHVAGGFGQCTSAYHMHDPSGWRSMRPPFGAGGSSAVDDALGAGGLSTGGDCLVLAVGCGSGVGAGSVAVAVGGEGGLGAGGLGANCGPPVVS